MRKALVLLGTALPLVAACRDSLGEHGIPTAPRPSTSVSVRPEALEPEATGQDLWSRLSAEEKRAAMNAIEREYAAQGAVYLRGQIAIVPGSLPDGAHAILVRDPASPNRPLLVLSELTMDDDAISSAITALSKDLERAPQPAERRILRITPNPHGGDHMDRHERAVTGPILPRVSGRALAERLYAQATSLDSIDVPGIGRAKLLRFE